MFLGEFIIKGGVTMVLLVVLSVYVLAVVVYKFYQFRKLSLSDNSFITAALNYLHQGKKEKAINVLKNSANPLGEALISTLQIVSEKKLDQERKIMLIHSVGNQQLEVITSRLYGLEVIASISPLLGLLGTVIGMVKAFSGIESAGSNVDPSILAGGIWEALLTTIAGLVVAIVAYSAFHYFNAKVDQSRSLLEHSVAHIFAGK